MPELMHTLCIRSWRKAYTHHQRLLYARLGQESHTEHNGKTYNAYDFLHGKSKSSVEAIEQ